MLPDLRLLIPATVVTFFLAAALGLFASLRLAQEAPYPRPDQFAALDDTPIARISANWPLPESGRSAALRDLAKVVKLDPSKGPVASDASLPLREPRDPSPPAVEPEPISEEPHAIEPAAPPVASTPPIEAPAPKPEPMTEGQRVASRAEPATHAIEGEEPAQVAPAEVVKPRVRITRIARKRARSVRRSSDPFAHLPLPGFASPYNFSVYGRHNQPR